MSPFLYLQVLCVVGTIFGLAFDSPRAVFASIVSYAVLVLVEAAAKRDAARGGGS